jgi:hypothetical protein
MPAFVLHAHFYQPPRENPWTGAVPREASAAPAHDWNERITTECYRPNAFARIVDDAGAVVAIVNNYSLMSFDLGPTLAVWLEQHHPDVLERIVEADRAHGTAIAHPFHHSILPLATAADARTEIRWGIAEFRHRFGRVPAGFWLPETALDDAVLAMLVEEGVSFTIVAPTQLAVAPAAVPARWHHPDGRGIDLVVYDGELAQQLAFGMSGLNAQALLDEFARHRVAPLVVAATDGETFGHHHPFTERAVAYAFAVLAKRAGIATGSLADRLGEVVDRQHARVIPSAWSCAHGLDRWRRDCGCTTGGELGWNQQWRAPLRAALERLRDHAHSAFETLGASVFNDPWAARDDYVGVLLDPHSVEAFAAKHLRGDADLVRALTLLEMQRHALAMFTSCGWFFSDLAGLEAVQNLRYAARCFDLLVELGDTPPIEDVLALLAQARSNDPAEGDGRRVWERRVLSARVEADRIVAHLAIVELLRGGASSSIGAFDVNVIRHARTRGPVARLETGRVDLMHRRTRRVTQWSYAVAGDEHYDVLGVVLPVADAVSSDAVAIELHRLAEVSATIGPVHQLLIERHGGRRFGLDVMIMDLAPRLVGDIAAPALMALTRRALGSGHVGHVRAARRFLRSLETAGVPVDIAPVQEAFYRANEVAALPPELDDLGRDLRLAVGSLGLS